ncbi:MAG: DUF5686 family protein, partial [Dysgonamonadaceae bacterium]|nr:DUF5686 family protein [Dysgonamonadaceae bacterium]
SAKARKKYHYYLSDHTIIDGRSCYEIAFFSQKLKTNAFEGYLYLSEQDSSLVKATYTLNNSMGLNLCNDVVITQTFTQKEGQIAPLAKEFRIFFGDDIKGGVMVTRSNHYSDAPADSLQIPLTLSQQQIGALMQEAQQTRAYRNTCQIISLLLTDHLSVKKKWEIGRVSEMISFNEMEGLRLKAGGNTTPAWNSHLLLGGYAAYGLSDKLFKYRGDVAYSFRRKDKSIWEYPNALLSFSYVSDLNLPGENLLTTDRDFFMYSFASSGTNNMSWQRIAQFTYDQELPHWFSFSLGAKYLHDEPKGVIEYRSFVASEASLSLRYAPHEKFIQNREDRMYFREGDVELSVKHRIGVKGVFNSDYQYHISSLDAATRFYFPSHAGTLDVHVSAGKVWNRLPFPLLFIPAGNQSYIYEENDYNLMRYHEFATDRYASGRFDFLFNWSPVRWISPRSKIKMTLGTKLLYGPLSDNNNPALHSELFAFNHGINPLGSDPYVEVNIGLAGILRFFRIDWVQRLTYLDPDSNGKIGKGSIFVTASIGL